jgi:hypothetical protein
MKILNYRTATQLVQSLKTPIKKRQGTLREKLKTWLLNAAQAGAGSFSPLLINQERPLRVQQRQMQKEARLESKISKICVLRARDQNLNI